jgi:hypothetical protein
MSKQLPLVICPVVQVTRNNIMQLQKLHCINKTHEKFAVHVPLLGTGIKLLYIVML